MEFVTCLQGLLYSSRWSLASQWSWARMVKASYRLSTHLRRTSWWYDELIMMMDLGVWRMRKVAVVKIRMTARLCSLLSLCCTVSCLLNTLPWPPPFALIVRDKNWKGWPHFSYWPLALAVYEPVSEPPDGAVYLEAQHGEDCKWDNYWKVNTGSQWDWSMTISKKRKWKLTGHYHPEPWRVKHDVIPIFS